jgi:hypothetical protein
MNMRHLPSDKREHEIMDDVKCLDLGLWSKCLGFEDFFFFCLETDGDRV